MTSPNFYGLRRAGDALLQGRFDLVLEARVDMHDIPSERHGCLSSRYLNTARITVDRPMSDNPQKKGDNDDQHDDHQGGSHRLLARRPRDLLQLDFDFSQELNRTRKHVVSRRGRCGPERRGFLATSTGLGLASAPAPLVATADRAGRRGGRLRRCRVLRSFFFFRLVGFFRKMRPMRLPNREKPAGEADPLPASAVRTPS